MTVGLGVEVRQLLERIAAQVELGVEGQEGVVLLGIEGLAGKGRHADIIEGVDGVDLQFELLHREVAILVAVVLAHFLGVREIPLDLAGWPTLHPFDSLNIL